MFGSVNADGRERGLIEIYNIYSKDTILKINLYPLDKGNSCFEGGGSEKEC